MGGEKGSGRGSWWRGGKCESVDRTPDYVSDSYQPDKV
jgi:hypothetical protein